jgi:DNA polymerase-1
VIVSGDKDFYQLIKRGISLLNPGRGGAAAIEEHWVDEANASERLGVPPDRVVDYLALVGDSSDNIPGVKGVGEKTARTLIEQYGNLDSILARAAEVSGKRAREALLEHSDAARLSRELVTIRRDVPIELELDKLQVVPADSAALRRLFTELEFHTLLPKVEAAPAPEPATLQVITTPQQLAGAVHQVRAAETVAIIIVTSHDDPLRGNLVGVALASSPAEVWYIPLGHRAPEVATLDGDEIPENFTALSSAEAAPLRDLLSDAALPKMGHDVKRAWLALRRSGVELAGLQYDSMLASFVLDPGRRSHELVTLASDYLGIALPTYVEATRQGKDRRSVAEVPPPELARICCAEARAVLALRDYLAPRVAELGLTSLLDRIELPLVGVLTDIEFRGIKVDPEGLKTLSRQFGTELSAIEAQIYQEAGTDFNINSTPQLRQILFEKLLLPVIKKTKTGPSTDADVLEQLAEMGFAVPRLLMEYRELSKLKSTYVDALPLSVNPDTGRIHTRFNQTGAATGRLSSSDPNLQNIPIRTRRGEQIRRCFLAAEGNTFVVADYSQIELRLLAHMSEDPVFIGAFERGGDVHRETAAIIFDVPVDQVTSEMRGRAKTINFATIYGQGPFALSRQLNITQEQAREFIRRYFERFAGVRRFLDSAIEKARARGYAETIEGRRRYIPELKDPNYNIRSFGERTAMNSPLQGSAADLIKIAMIGVDRAMKKRGVTGGMVLQVHDELIVETQIPNVDAASEIVRHEMESAATLRVPLVVDIGVGPNWLDAKR